MSSPLPSTAMIASASRIVGNDSWMSAMRMTTSSTEPAEIARQQADQQADRAGDRDGGEADDQRYARAVDDAAEHVAAKRISAQPEGRFRRR